MALVGTAANRLVGVGFVALAQDDAACYVRQPAAGDPRARFIFEGTSEGDTFGGYGSVCGAAVSQEIDRCNPLLGSPLHALILASALSLPADFTLCREEADALYRGVPGPKLRADMVFFETPAGGAAFSTGSIGFAGSLAHNNYANDICRIATNVLERFVDPRLSRRDVTIMHMTNKIALVTGAGSGIGRAASLALQEAGYSVVLAGRRAAELEKTVARPSRRAARCSPCPRMSATRSRSMRCSPPPAKRSAGWTCSSTTPASARPAIPMEELTYEQWSAVVDVNLTGAFLCAQEAIRMMKAQDPRGGRIINNGSISAHTPRPELGALHGDQARHHRTDEVPSRSTAGSTTSPAARSISATPPPR